MAKTGAQTTPTRLARAIKRDLRAQADPARAQGEKKYLKSDLEFIGCTVPAIRKLCRSFRREHADLSREAVLELADALWNTRVHELRSMGVGLLAEYVPVLRAKDMALMESILVRANTWAHVDWLAITVVGALVRRYASAAKRLARWAKHDNLWVRRSAMLGLLEDLRAGEGDFEAFERYASAMLHEREFFIRKAIGWVLREVAKKRPELTEDFVRRHRAQMSGLSKREALKHFAPRVRAELLG